MNTPLEQKPLIMDLPQEFLRLWNTNKADVFFLLCLFTKRTTAKKKKKKTRLLENFKHLALFGSVPGMDHNASPLPAMWRGGRSGQKAFLPGHR